MGAVLSGVTMGLVAAVMILLGISQVRSRKPVGFYSGQTPPKVEELTDVGEWNRKHGTMWIVYGVGIVIAWAVMLVMGDDTPWVLAPVMLGIVGPLPIMIRYHKRLVKEYMR